MTSDIFVPSSSADEALVDPLHTVTYITADKESVQTMFCDGMDLEMSAWSTPTPEQRQTLNPYFGFAADDQWQSAVFNRSAELANIQVRVIVVDKAKPMVRPELDGRYFGGATIGFPMLDMEAREAKMADAGIKSTVGVKRLEFAGAGGETYVSSEIHFAGTENVFILGVERPDIFVQVGPVDHATKIGAAAYSCRCVPNLDTVNEFCRDVLGYELRRDMAMTVGPRSGLKLEEGMPERFVQAFAPGSATAYLVFLEHGGQGIPSPAPSMGPPNRGLVMWSFATKNLDEVHQRAIAAGVEILHSPEQRHSPHLPVSRTLLVNDPSGFPIEIFEV